MAEGDLEVAGVKVRRTELESGPQWAWREEMSRGIVAHSSIQWVRETRKWRRGSAISEPGIDGGWNVFPVLYDRAESDEEAAEVVQRVLEREFNAPKDYP